MLILIDFQLLLSGSQVGQAIPLGERGDRCLNIFRVRGVKPIRNSQFAIRN